MKLNILYIIITLSCLFSDTYEGYLREIETSMCMDQCSEYMLENEFGVSFINVIALDELDLSYFINRYVEIQGESEYQCLMCSALIIEHVNISNECEYPVSCFADPCDVADECQINTPVECISNYCEGCYADFYDLEGELVDCNTSIINPCDDIGGVNFGMCDMYLGVAIIDGFCQAVSGCGWEINGIDYTDAFFASFFDCEESCLNEPNLCEDIENEYNQLYYDMSSGCENDTDCISLWGDCSVGLGGCHYSINETLYNEDYLDYLVSDWVDNDCMDWVCDCFDLPESICNNDGNCELAYCIEENPEGCVVSGCLDNYACIDYEETGDCVSSNCYCDEYFGEWFCTEDCNGGTCFQLGDINYDNNLDVVDVVMIVNSILSISYMNILSDVNSDGITNVMDVIILVNMILD